MADTHTLQELAKAKTREDLRTPAFLSLPPDEQRTLFQERYTQNYADLARAQSAPPRAEAMRRRPDRASDRIDDDRHLNERIEQAGELAGDFVQNVDFPGFVRDLLKGVFDANLAVQTQQIETYQELLKTATASVAKFVNAIDDTAAFGYLAENNSDEFNIDFSDSDTDESGQPAAMLTSADGEPVDIGDNEVKAKIMDAKIAMAKEQRALLREIILMGVTRLVVEKGEVKASVLFDIKASERVKKADKAALKESVSSSRSISGGGGLIGKIFGGPSGGHTRSKRKTEISVSSAKSEASTDLAAKLAGSVNIQFKSDYFKLDNFAEMYGPQANVGGGGGAGSGNPGPQGGGQGG
ncbi:MAG: hypothetical protein RKE49_00080 [Oceanicaulis sp.]